MMKEVIIEKCEDYSLNKINSVLSKFEKLFLDNIHKGDSVVIKKLPESRMTFFRHIGIVLRCVGVGLLVVALARPQKGTSEEEVTSEGVDIMLVLDVSYSMRSLDFQPKNRLFVAKETLKDFTVRNTSRTDRPSGMAFPQPECREPSLLLFPPYCVSPLSQISSVST